MPIVSSDLNSSLWDFSLACYARAGVADMCLRLQDEQGVNVNLLLWCAWLDARGLVLDATRLHNAQKRIHAWDEHYVVPLRHLRRRMKVEFGMLDAEIEAVRVQIKQAELLAERQLQLWLEAATADWDDDIDPTNSLSAGSSNVHFYLQHMNVTAATISQVSDLFEDNVDN